MAHKTRATIYIPIYPLSTKSHSSLRDSFEMFNTIYKNLLKNTISSNITLMGDSAGANMALVMAQQLKILQLPKPAHVILLSPAVDFNIDDSTGKKLSAIDPILP
ncbi:hypothetical protein FACS1894218_2470 [Bacilli bacterium]|nr:hypothetical protein FACS1894218_2470 [Bacilli bacterium]